MRIHVLDANALYRYLTDGEGAGTVAAVFKDALAAKTSVLMSVENWGEVLYTLIKRVGIPRAEQGMAELRARVPLELVSIAEADAVRAARLKAQFHLPYADAFAAVVAGTQNVLVTSDVEHFQRLPRLRLLKLPRAGKSR